ncbi:MULTISPECIES: hypothetical protein [Niastella]|uniref:Uncharacterized protein n=1 Tax=Niastella soli TaxID=2821487 RepID=A0ABS3YVD4_9BACT|nr:hypothetical protein [Niastella soli]MBO9201889.1 hypothetical protein [Niastella soli]
MKNLNNTAAEVQLLKSELEVAQMQQIKQKEINRAVLAAREKERAKINLEIQENLNQLLVAALLYIELAETDDEIRKICLQRSRSFISIVIKELTIISRSLANREINRNLAEM